MEPPGAVRGSAPPSRRGRCRSRRPFSVMNCVPFRSASGSARSAPAGSARPAPGRRSGAGEVERVGHADRAHQAELAPARTGRSARTWPPAAAAPQASMPARWLMAWNWKSPKAIPPSRDRRGGSRSPDPRRAAVARVQHRRVAVGDPRQLVQPAAGERAHAVEMRRQMRQQVGRQVQRQQRRQPGVGAVEVQAAAVGHGLGAGGRGLRRRGWADTHGMRSFPGRSLARPGRKGSGSPDAGFRSGPASPARRTNSTSCGPFPPSFALRRAGAARYAFGRPTKQSGSARRGRARE